MKKFFAVMSAVLLLLTAFAACGGKSAEAEVSIDYGTSDLYTQADREQAVSLIRQEFSGWEGCELHAIRYAGDECQSEENLSWMNDLREGEDFTQCIEFFSDFHSPKQDAGAWNPDQEYTDWQWWLARPEGGEWQLLTWGY
jgi:D-alanyl-D-alanine carboxypeptidase